MNDWIDGQLIKGFIAVWKDEWLGDRWIAGKQAGWIEGRWMAR